MGVVSCDPNHRVGQGRDLQQRRDADGGTGSPDQSAATYPQCSREAVPPSVAGRRALDRRVENLCAIIGRISVGVHDQIVAAVVDGMKRGAYGDVHDTTGRHVDALGWLAQLHGQRSAEHDEGFLLLCVAVALAVSPRFV